MAQSRTSRPYRLGVLVHALDRLSREIRASATMPARSPSSESPQAIPGAFRIDPSRLRNSPRISVPDDVEIVLYCSSRSEIVSAQAALALRRIGVENVWILEGGIHGWREKGLPLSQFPEAPEAVAERLGVRLPDA